MIKFNFIPDQQRLRGAQLTADDFGGIPAEMLVGSILAFLGFLVVIHLVLAGVAGYKFASVKILQVRWEMMGADKRAYDDVIGELTQLQSKMMTLKPITVAQSLHWANFMSDISESVPKGVWIRQIVFDKGLLSIQGCAVSKIKSEMSDAGDFVANLKVKRSIKENFSGLEVESIQRRDNLSVSVADFLLKAKRK
ncbi:MAG: PilN domain-containing protein [Candidatus Omnitrophota bacterium]